MLSLAIVSLAECTHLFLAQQTVVLVKQVAATSTFCPVICLVGAKRPQDRGWHFVVFSLWLILSLPAFEALLLRPGGLSDVRGLRTVFQFGLIGFGFVNTLPTRYWLASILFAGAQWSLLHDSHSALISTVWPAKGLILFLASLAAAARTARRPVSETSPLDRLWLDFRDQYGLLWSLRVVEQINSTAEMTGWDVRLTWRGFRRPDGSPLVGSIDANTERGLRQNLHNLLRRFVSPTWIAERLPP